MSSTLLDFSLELTRSPDTDSGYAVVFTDNKTERRLETAPAPPRFRFDRWRAQYGKLLENHVEEPLAASDLQILGEELARLLLPASLRAALCGKLHLRRSPSAPTRLRLYSEEPFWNAMPWEFAYLDDTDFEGFLCHIPGLHLIRGAEQTQARKPLRLPERLRVLIAWANPVGSGYLAHIDEEVKAVLAALNARTAAARFQCRELAEATPETLAQAIAEFQPHVLHFIGHGDDFHEAALILHPSPGTPLSGEALAEMLESAPEMRFVLLSACNSAGVGNALLRRGVPIVIAMQLPWRDLSGGAFARNFYGNLAQPVSVEEALWHARQHIALPSLPGWGVPTLSLAGASSELSLARPKIPHNLPKTPSRHFTGRDAVLGEIEKNLLLDGGLTDPTSRRVALVGMGGSGKTEIALQFAHRLLGLDCFPGGVFWLNADSTAHLAEDFAEVGRAEFGVSERDPLDERVEKTRRRFMEQDAPFLLICDNLSAKTELDGLPVTAPCHLLATTREWNSRRERDFERLEIKPLEETPALRLLFAYCPALDAADERAARKVAERVGYLAIALELVANYVQEAGISYAEYLSRQMPRSVLEPLREVIAVSRKKLSAEQRNILALTSCFAARAVSPDLLYKTYCRAYHPMPRENFDVAAGVLVNYSLLSRDAPLPDETGRRLTAHDVIHEVAAEELTEAERRNLLSCAAAVLAERLRRANRQELLQEARREMPHAECAVALLGSAELYLEMGKYYLKHCEDGKAFRVLQKALPLAEAEFGECSLLVAAIMQQLARVYQQFYGQQKENRETNGEWARDYARQALERAEALDAANEELVDYCTARGYVLKMQKRLTEAEPHYLRALELCEPLARAPEARREHRIQYAYCLNYVGMFYKEQNRLEEARRALQQALDIYSGLFGSKHYHVAVLTNNLGQIFDAMQNHTKSRDCHQQALEIYDAIYGRPHPEIAYTLHCLGKDYLNLGQQEESIGYLRTGLNMHRLYYEEDYVFIEEAKKLIADAEKILAQWRE